MGTSNQSNKQTLAQDVVQTGSPMSKKGRKVLSIDKLPFSPRVKPPQINKVFVVGAPLGVILIRTERQNGKDDAFTNNAQKILEDEESGVAKRLNIIKICSRRCSQLIDKAIMQTTSYPSTWFVSIVDEDKNTPEYRLEHVSQFIKFLNETDWKYPQQFQLIADETKMENGTISGSLDMFILNFDIPAILKYLFKGMNDFLEDEDAITACFGKKCTLEKAKDYVKEAW